MNRIGLIVAGQDLVDPFSDRGRLAGRAVGEVEKRQNREIVRVGRRDLSQLGGKATFLSLILGTAVVRHERHDRCGSTVLLEVPRAVKWVEARDSDRIGIAEIVQPRRADKPRRDLTSTSREPLGIAADSVHVPPSITGTGEVLTRELVGDTRIP